MTFDVNGLRKKPLIPARCFMFTYVSLANLALKTYNRRISSAMVQFNRAADMRSLNDGGEGKRNRVFSVSELHTSS